MSMALSQISKGGEAREMRGTDHDHHHHHVHHSKSTPSFFFNLKDIKAGNKVPFYFEKRLPRSASRFLPRAKADDIPFSSKQLPYLLKLFSFPPGSKEAIEVEDTLKSCEARPVTGETRFCATSMESMLDSVVGVFGISSQFSDPPTLLTTTFRSNDLDKVNYQNFTVLEGPREISASKMIGCHSFAYPYTIFFCHTQDGGTKGFRLSLRGENGDEVDAVSVCHMDTSEWDPNHRSFSELGTKPGDPVCHIFPPHGNLLWVHHSPKNHQY